MVLGCTHAVVQGRVQHLAKVLPCVGAVSFVLSWGLVFCTHMAVRVLLLALFSFCFLIFV